MSINRSQIILITTFSLIIILGVVYISLLPISNLLKSLRESSDYYQSLNFSNDGIEISYFSSIKVSGYDLLSGTYTRSGNSCDTYDNFRMGVCANNNVNNILNLTSKYCNYLDGYLNLQVATTNQINGYSIKTMIKSQGAFKNKLTTLRVYVIAAECYY